MDVVVAVVVLLLLGVWTVVLLNTNTDIPWLLRVSPLVGWLLCVAASVTASLVLTMVGTIILGIGLLTDVLYERVVGGGSKSKGRHGLGR